MRFRKQHMKLTLLGGGEIYELELSVNLNLNGRKSTFTTKMSGSSKKVSEK